MSQDRLDRAEQELLDAAAGGEPADGPLGRALATASTWIGESVSVVGVGELPSGAPCLVVHTTAPDELPDDVEGVPVVAVDDDRPRALDDDHRPRAPDGDQPAAYDDDQPRAPDDRVH